MIAVVDATGIWALVGQIAVVVGLFGGVLAIVRHFRTPQERLEAVIRTHDFKMPYKNSDSLEGYYEFLKATFSAAARSDATFPTAKTYAFEKEWNRGALSALKYCRAMIYVKIDNIGTKKCSGVTIHLPERARITEWLKSDISSLSVGNREVSVGDLAPKQTIKAWIWSGSDKWNASSGLSVTHDTGIAKRRLSYSTTKIGKSLESLGIWVLFSTSIAFLFLVLLFGVHRCSPSRVAKERRNEGSPSPTPAVYQQQKPNP